MRLTSLSHYCDSACEEPHGLDHSDDCTCETCHAVHQEEGIEHTKALQCCDDEIDYLVTINEWCAFHRKRSLYEDLAWCADCENQRSD